MLPQITQTAMSAYQNAQDREEQKKARKRVEDLQQLGILQNAAQGGAEVNQQIERLAGRLGIESFIAPVTSAQDRGRIEKMPEKGFKLDVAPVAGLNFGVTADIKGRESVTDDRLKRAGLETRDEKAIREFAGTQRARTTTMAPLQDFAAVQQYIASQAPAYIRQWMAKNKTPITAENAEQMVDQAYGEWFATQGDRIPESMRSDGRAAFASVAFETKQAQEKDAFTREIETARINLERARVAIARGELNRRGSGGGGGGGGDQYRITDDLNALSSGLMRYLDNIPTAQKFEFQQAMMRGVKPEGMIETRRAAYIEFMDATQRVGIAQRLNAMAIGGGVGTPEYDTLLKQLSSARPGGRTETVAPGTTPDVTTTRQMRGTKMVVTPEEKRRLLINHTWDPAIHVLQ